MALLTNGEIDTLEHWHGRRVRCRSEEGGDVDGLHGELGGLYLRCLVEYYEC